MGSPGRRYRRGFTLVELLVVIGIIAVLIGILLPTLAKARESANAIKCAAHMRAVGQGMAQYLVPHIRDDDPAGGTIDQPDIQSLFQVTDVAGQS